MPIGTARVRGDVVAALRRAFIAAAVAAGLAPIATPRPAMATGVAPSCFLASINGARAAAGLPGLAAGAELTAVAAAHSQQMAVAGIIFHNADLAAEAPSTWRTLGENVGRGPTCEDIARAFLASPEHRVNILNPQFDSVGIGAALSGRVMFVTEDFMQSGYTGGEAVATQPEATPPTSAAPAVEPAVVAAVPVVPAPPARPARAAKPTPRPSPSPTPGPRVTRSWSAPVGDAPAPDAADSPVPASSLLAALSQAARLFVAGVL